MIVMLQQAKKRKSIKVLDQDREFAYDYNGTQRLRVKKVMHDGQIIAYNVIIDGSNIGTFDYLTDALMEIAYIEECNTNYYVVNGFDGGAW